MRIWMMAPLGFALAVGACGDTTAERATTGSLGGAAVGAAVGGPAGAVIGGSAGAAGGVYRDEMTAFVDEQFEEEEGMGQAQARVQQPISRAGPVARTAAMEDDLTNAEVRQAQLALQELGYYEGEIDGLYGPRTIEAVREYQRTQNLPQTAALTDQTLASLTQQAEATGQPDGARPQDQQQQGMQPGGAQEPQDTDQMQGGGQTVQ